jgi:hypothetical protein
MTHHIVILEGNSGERWVEAFPITSNGRTICGTSGYDLMLQLSPYGVDGATYADVNGPQYTPVLKEYTGTDDGRSASEEVGGCAPP